MPSMHSDQSKRQGVDAGALLILTAAQAAPLLQAMGSDRIGLLGSAMTAALAVAAAGMVRLARRVGAQWLHMLIYMLLFGNLGLLAGAWLDFGSAGLVGLTHWCHMHAGLEPGVIAAKLTGAPWSYGLMLLGCNLGMRVSELVWRRQRPGMAVHRAGRGAAVVRCYIACDLGMLAGMLLAEGLMPGGHHHDQIAMDTILLMLFVLGLGMSVGMLLGWWVSMGNAPRSLARIAALPDVGESKHKRA